MVGRTRELDLVCLDIECIEVLDELLCIFIGELAHIGKREGPATLLESLRHLVLAAISV